jgi:hypothetical protein
MRLKDFFPEIEAKFGTLLGQLRSELWWTAIEDGDLAFVLILQLLKHFVPVWSPRLGPCLEACDKVTVFLSRKIKLKK